MKTDLDQFDVLAKVIRSCDEMLVYRSDAIDICLLHEARARANERLKQHLKELNFEQLWALCNSKLGPAMALEKAAKALAVVDIPDAAPHGNIELVANNDGNDVVAWVPEGKEGPAS